MTTPVEDNIRVEDPPAEGLHRPAELTTFVGSLALAAAAFGIELPQEAIIGGFIALGTLPAVVSWYVDHFRSYLR